MTPTQDVFLPHQEPYQTLLLPHPYNLAPFASTSQRSLPTPLPCAHMLAQRTGSINGPSHPRCLEI
jgi:hypothetical protein